MCCGTYLISLPFFTTFPTLLCFSFCFNCSWTTPISSLLYPSPLPSCPLSTRLLLRSPQTSPSCSFSETSFPLSSRLSYPLFFLFILAPQIHSRVRRVSHSLSPSNHSPQLPFLSLFPSSARHLPRLDAFSPVPRRSPLRRVHAPSHLTARNASFLPSRLETPIKHSFHFLTTLLLL